MNATDENILNLSAEEFYSVSDLSNFQKYHSFDRFENSIIQKIIAHGPLLIRGSRGSGKSALLIEAERRINREPRYSGSAFGVYFSLRNTSILKSSDYIPDLVQCLCAKISENLKIMGYDLGFVDTESEENLLKSLDELARKMNKRIVLIFDDAAHVSRERALEPFFDMFRRLNNNNVSCKAAIYPGVTQFGRTFDVYNDANIVEVSRNMDTDSAKDFFVSVRDMRFGSSSVCSKMSNDEVFLLSRSVLGNVRAFIRCLDFAVGSDCCDSRTGLTLLDAVLKKMATDHFWPLFDEVEPKLGIYGVLVPSAKALAEKLYEMSSGRQTVLIHKDFVDRLRKSIEVLEYVGFILRREASVALKSGGRGTRYSLNLCNLIEHVPGTKLTKTIFEDWLKPENIASANQLASSNLSIEKIAKEQPKLPQELAQPLSILSQDIDFIKRSKVYPYGLTDDFIEKLKSINIHTIDQLLVVPLEKLYSIKGIKEARARMIKSAAELSVWM